MALSLPGLRGSAERFCRVCAAGTFRSDPQVSAPCQPCPAGFTCPPGKCSCHGGVGQEIAASIESREFRVLCGQSSESSAVIKPWCGLSRGFATGFSW